MAMDLDFLAAMLNPKLLDEELRKQEIRKFLYEGDVRVLALAGCKEMTEALDILVSELEHRNNGYETVGRFSTAIRVRRRQGRRCFW